MKGQRSPEVQTLGEIQAEVAMAILTVARQVVFDVVVEQVTEELWQMYPDLGEDDWLQITLAAREIVTAVVPTEKDYHKAYDGLAERAAQT